MHIQTNTVACAMPHADPRYASGRKWHAGQNDVRKGDAESGDPSAEHLPHRETRQSDSDAATLTVSRRVYELVRFRSSRAKKGDTVVVGLPQQLDEFF